MKSTAQIELRARLAGHAVTIRQLKEEVACCALKNDHDVQDAARPRRAYARTFAQALPGAIAPSAGRGFRDAHVATRENRRLTDAANDFKRQRVCELLSAAVDKHSARARAIHLAYGFLRGRAYAEMERNPRCRPPLRRVAAVFIRTVGGRDHALNIAFDDWLVAADAHWRASFGAHLERARSTRAQRAEVVVTVPA